MTLLQPQTLKLYYLIFDSLAISAILKPEVRKVLSPPHCQRKSCCCLHINPVCRFVLASQPQRFVFFHSQMKCGFGIELVSDGGRAMNPLLSPGSILKEPRGSWKRLRSPQTKAFFHGENERFDGRDLRFEIGGWMRRLGRRFFIGNWVEYFFRGWYIWAVKALSTGRNNRRHSWNYSEGWCSAMKECRRIWSTLRMALPVFLNQEGDSSRSWWKNKKSFLIGKAF